MHEKMTHFGAPLLLLARPADSLCSIIQSWAIAHRWSDLVFCHSVYDIEIRLDDIAPQQMVILIARPAMLNKPFLSSVLQKRPALRLIGWTGPEQTVSQQLATISSHVSIVTISDTEQLTNVLGAFRTTLTHEPMDSRQGRDAATESQIDPNNYRLSNDEIDALLGAE